MAERILLIAGGFALLISAIAFGIDGQPLTAGIIAFVAVIIFWFGNKTSSDANDFAVKGKSQPQEPIPSAQEIRRYREEHPGAGILEAVHRLRND